MLRSLLVAIDATPSGKAAARHAFALAQRSQAYVQSLGIVTSGLIRRPQAVPIGEFGLQD